MTETSPNQRKVEKAKASRAALIILIAVSIGVSGPIAINIHQAAHVLCAVKGECFGATSWLEGISGLPIWNLLFGTGAASLFILSALSHFYIFPKLLPLIHHALNGSEKEMLNLGQLRKSSIICMLFSSILWVAMLIASFIFYQGALS